MGWVGSGHTKWTHGQLCEQRLVISDTGEIRGEREHHCETEEGGSECVAGSRSLESSSDDDRQRRTDHHDP